MSKFVIPKKIKVHDVELEIVDLNLSDSVDGSSWEARADYDPKYKLTQGGASFSLTFNSEARFKELLALAGGEIIDE